MKFQGNFSRDQSKLGLIQRDSSLVQIGYIMNQVPPLDQSDAMFYCNDVIINLNEPGTTSFGAPFKAQKTKMLQSVKGFSF